jgi:glycosyltransferase involved in cell wall biosynthesis
MAISQFHPVPGGAENQALALARRLVREGCQVTIVTQHRKGLPASERLGGVRVDRRIRALPFGPFFGLTYVASLALYLLLRGWRHDVLHAHQLYLDAAILSLFALVSGKPCLAKVACSGEDGDVRRLDRLKGSALLWRAIRRMDRVVALTEEMRRELLASGFRPEQIVVIPNGVDAERFLPPRDRAAARARLRLEGEVGERRAKIVIFLGRLTRQKDWRTLLQALMLLQGGPVRTELLVLGEGPERQDLLNERHDLGLERSVRVLGSVSDPLPYYHAADAFVLPTRSEGLSNSLLEAMATGLPCVATRLEANAEVVDDGADGILVKGNDPGALAGALRRVLADPGTARRLGDAARSKALTHFALDGVAARYLALYRDLLRPCLTPGGSRRQRRRGGGGQGV